MDPRELPQVDVEKMAEIASTPINEQDELAVSRRDYAILAMHFAEVSQELASNTALLSGSLLPPDEQPIYELKEPYYSPDDVYYPAGAQFVDVTGRIVPNEFMIPLNRAAQDKLEIYLSRLPDNTATPPIDLIVQAAMELRPRADRQGKVNPEAEIDYHAAILRRAMELNYQRAGVMPGWEGQRVARPRTVERGPANVPIMSNTRIQGMASPFNPRPATRLQADSPTPAASHVPAMSMTRSKPLGQPMPGVSATRQ